MDYFRRVIFILIQTHYHSLKTVLDNNNKTLDDYNIKSEQTLIVKNLGSQILWRTVFYVEYFGPMLVQTAFYMLGKKEKYSPIQKIGYLMNMGHFAKREFETAFVHKFSRDSMPLKRLFMNCFHYWVVCGFNIGIDMFHFKDYSTKNLTKTKKMFIGAFIFCELMNFLCHFKLSNIRTDDQKKREIPNGFGFGLVSSANYMWECLSWVFFTLFTESGLAGCFTLISFIQMLVWARDKHRRYKKEFGQEFPKNRKAMIPFLV